MRRPRTSRSEAASPEGKLYLLDTNIVSDLVKRPAGRVAQRIEMVGQETVCTSVIVSSELRYGALKKGSTRLTRQLEAVLSALDVLPLQESVDRRCARLRLALEQGGEPIGGNDLLIAAHALALGLTLITANEREFARVPSLKLQNWLTD